MKEQDLIDLGFERIDISAKESGDKAYHYYVYAFTEELLLISCYNDEVFHRGWFVQFFDCIYIDFFDKDDVKTLIQIINRNKI